MHQNYIKIGKALKTHGFKGNLKIEVEDIYIKDFDKCTYVFINNIPYFIEEKNIESEYIYIKFEDIESKEEAQLLCSQDIFLEKKQLNTLNQNLVENIIGYAVFDKQRKIGLVEEKIILPQQQLISIKIDKKEVFIPLNEIFVVEINHQQQKIILNLPENYLETFLS
jgi:16S rRNA processing protein RimM